jgi:hypothetical protein
MIDTLSNNMKFKNEKHFEETLVQALIVDTVWAEQMIEVLDTDFFNLEYLKELTKLIFNYQKKYKFFPSYKLLVILVRDEVHSDNLKELMIGYLLRIKKDTSSITDIDYVKEKSLDFCRKRALARALENSLSFIEEKKYEQILKEIQNALSAGSEKNLGHMYNEQFDLRMTKEEYHAVPTPWPEINSITKGGPRKWQIDSIRFTVRCGKVARACQRWRTRSYDGTKCSSL